MPESLSSNGKAVRNVIFDLGGVLLEWSPDRILEACFADPAAREAVREGAMLHPDWQELDRGTLLEIDAVERFAERCGRSCEEMVAFFRHVKRSLVPIDGTVRLLEELHGRGVPLYCLSNMTEPCANYLRAAYGFFGCFRDIVISGEIRMIKPDPAIYRHALRQFGLAAHETVFIDDRADNCESARQVGLHAIQFASAEDCRRRLLGMLDSR